MRLTAMLLSLASAASAFAQTRTISGKVVDEQGLPVIGASVMLENDNTTGTVTDMDGAYTLDIPGGQGLTLSYSCIGYVTQTVAVGNRATIDVILAEDNEFLEGTVVIGYGVQRKSDVTGAIASVGSDDIANRSVSNVAEALQGKAAGVQILNSSGAPGSTPTIQIRGYSSNSKTAPLIIVDGLKVDSIDYLDPDNIESMEILKDAASAAIYGIEAGNGVVLITTKSGADAGREGRIFYNFQHTLQQLGKMPDLLNAREYIEYQKLQGSATDETLQWDGVTDTYWPGYMFETGYMQRHTVGFQRGDDNGSFYASLSYLDNNGIIVGDKDIQKRLTGQVNADYKIKKWLQVGVTMSLDKRISSSVSEGAVAGTSLLGSVMMYDPITPWTYTEDNMPDRVAAWVAEGRNLPRDANGNIYGVSVFSDNSLIFHPMVMRDRADTNNDSFNIRGTAYINFMPFKGFVFTSRLGYRAGYSNSSTYNHELFINSMNNNDLGLSGTARNNLYYQWENFANYSNTFGKHSINAMVGMSFQRSTSNYVTGSGDELTSTMENFRYLSNLVNTTNMRVSGQPSESANMSYFARVGWSYDRRYNLQASFRADAYDTSKLDRDHRWGFFPSVSGGWTISNEEFMSSVPKNILSNLRLRASWGINGNVNALSSNYQYAPALSTGTGVGYNPSDGFILGVAPSSVLGNPEIKWETSHQVDIGLEARMLDDRLSIALDWYNKNTHDLLTSTNAPNNTGASTVYLNAGKVNNTGVEMELSWKDTIGDFAYDISGNFATLKNVVLEGISSERQQGSQVWSSDYVTYFEEGYPIWYLRTYVIDGINPETGEAIYRNFDDDPTINTEDRMMTGSAIPDLTYGITINLAWKGIDFTLYGAGVQGVEKLYALGRGDFPQANTLKYFYDNCWMPGRTGYTLPKPNYLDRNYRVSDAMVFDASFFKIKQIQLGYSFPKRLLNKIAVSNLRLYVSLDDWFTFTKYPGLDPETSGYGSSGSAMAIDYGSYPISKKVVFGVNVSF